MESKAYIAGFCKAASIAKEAGRVDWSPVIQSALMSALLSGGGTLAVNKGNYPHLAAGARV